MFEESSLRNEGTGGKRYAYFPGCSLHGTAREYDESTRYVCSELGIELEELGDWNCCGATSGHVMAPGVALGLSRRNLDLARRAGKDLLIPCIQCFQRLKEAWEESQASRQAGKNGEHRITSGTALSTKDRRGISSLPGREGPGVCGSQSGGEDIRLEYLANLLTSESYLREIGRRVVRPLEGFRLACYYGCLSVRPPGLMAQGNYENPTALDDLVRILGGEAIPWPFKTDCCGGGPMAVIYPEMTRQLSFRLFHWAGKWGANGFVTACPMCQMNLDSRQEETLRQHDVAERFPIFFLTELIALAWGYKEVGSWLERHFVQPKNCN